jgi:hypothetical protein
VIQSKREEELDRIGLLFAELLERLLTTCPRQIRGIGYLHELIKIRKCSRRWADASQPHFENVRNINVSIITRCERRRKAVIVGSGWLNDVPFDELVDVFTLVRGLAFFFRHQS